MLSTKTITYPAFGSSMSTRSYSSGAYRYGFNGKEKDAESFNDAYDFGARIYDGRLGRWLAVDPAQTKSPGYSSYNFCFNKPIIYSDPDGEYPLIVISSEVNGYSFANVYSVQSGKTTTVVVKTYKMVVYDVNAKGDRKELAQFYVTRDGYYNNGETTTTKTNTDGTTTTTKQDLLVNRTSEPKADVTLNAKATKDYGDTKGAYALGTVDAEPTPDSWNQGVNGEAIPSEVKRSVSDKATGVMIHIGGYFTKDGENNLAGYYGCYGIIDPSQVYNTYSDAEKNLSTYNNIEITGTAPTAATSSNSQMNKLVETVQNANKLATDRNETNASDIKVNIKKRSKGSYKKEVKITTSTTTQ